MIDLTYFLSLLKAAASTLKVATLGFKGVSFLSTLRGAKVNPLSLPDEDFMFITNRLSKASGRLYYPISSEEAQNCRSLCNLGVLRPAGGGYKLTWTNKCLVQKHNKLLKFTPAA